MNFAVLASGNGSNLQAIIEACRAGRIGGRLAVVISDKADAYALVRARQAGVPGVLSVNPKDYPSREAFDLELVRLLKAENISLVVLAGYMRILSPAFVCAFSGRIINIHPALLPAFKGAHAIKDALAAGVDVTGVTVHFVDEEVDHGPLIEQVVVSLVPGDTLESLAARIHQAEHVLYPQVIDRVLKGLSSIPVDGRQG
ncbi:MAG: phosphoribosylglycinamide formyltransferase [Candidatus Omnitrophota bacterium]